MLTTFVISVPRNQALSPFALTAKQVSDTHQLPTSQQVGIEAIRISSFCLGEAQKQELVESPWLSSDKKNDMISFLDTARLVTGFI
jgi:hypothetical protein